MFVTNIHNNNFLNKLPPFVIRNEMKNLEGSLLDRNNVTYPNHHYCWWKHDAHITINTINYNIDDFTLESKSVLTQSTQQLPNNLLYVEGIPINHSSYYQFFKTK
jgi:hypothetical protein